MKSHSEHIVRHVSQIRESRGEEVARSLLDISHLKAGTDAVVREDSGLPTDDDCKRYLNAVGEVLGLAAHSFARVNFILAGCEIANEK